mgnify:CR=1 FL=1
MPSIQAKRIVRQQEAIDGQNGAIQATLPGFVQVLNFTRSMQVKGDKELHIFLNRTLRRASSRPGNYGCCSSCS